MIISTIAAVLEGRRAGRGWIARCPAHRDRTPSLSIDIGVGGRPLVFCHAGCSQASVIAALRELGLWENQAELTAVPRQTGGARPKPDKAYLTTIAMRVWQEATPVDSSPAEAYLHSRGLHLPPPETLRFHSALRHPCGCLFPALIALVVRGTDEQPVAIHRTFLSVGGRRKAGVAPERMMLGPCRGGAVQLASVCHGDALLVGEGIETCLAGMQATGHPAWAALSTSGLVTLGLPPRVRKVIVLADGDDPGEAAALAAAHRWTCEGRYVRIARPPPNRDFNDVLLGGTGETVEARK